MHTTTKILTISAVALLSIASVGQAQGRGRTRGETEANWDNIAKGGSSGPSISAKDIEGMSPFKELLDKKKDLKLSDEQLAKFKTFDVALREKNAPLGKSVDSLRKELKPGTTAEDMARTAIARDALMGVLQQVQANNDAGVKDAMPVLDEAQQKMATAMLDKQKDESREMLQAKLGGRGGAPGGGARRRGAA